MDRRTTLNPAPLFSPARLFVRQARIYYVLCFPAIIAEIVFRLSIASDSAGVFSAAALLGSSAAMAVQMIPWALLGLSVFALIAFRPSILVALLTISFFISTAITGSSMVLFGLSLSQSVAFVVASIFFVLIGFNYSRGAKLLSGRKMKVGSDGPMGYQLLSLGIDLLLPLGAALGLVMFVGILFAGIKGEALLLPQPLSTLTSLYFNTRIGLAITTLSIAGAAIWTMRQVVEPIVMYFSLTASDAKKLALQEIEKTMSKARKESSGIPPSLIKGMIPSVVISLAMLIILLYFVGLERIPGDLMQIFTLQKSQISTPELTFQDSASKLDGMISGAVIQLDNLLGTIFRILWG